MPMYRVGLTQFANATIDVEADSPEQARLVAEDEAHYSLCHQCSREVDVDSMAWDAIEEDPVLVQ